MRLPKAIWGLVKETARHLLRRPVVGLVVVASTADGRFVLIRRGDSGQWCLPGGTLEWGETLRSTLARELAEETGAELISAGELLGVYSDPSRDPRFHAVTVVVRATVTEPRRPPSNPLEILEVGLFERAALPAHLSHGLTDVLARALAPDGGAFWE